VGPYGAQRRLQHAPPQVTFPEVLQIVPSTIEQLADPLAGCAQVPYGLPLALLHRPPQQSESEPHVSPLWPQKEDGAHTPPEQYWEQHWEPCVQALPRVRHPLFSAPHVPAEHVPLQHWALLEHAWPSDVHDATEQTPPTQFWLQHSLAFEHAAPFFRHAVPESPAFEPPPHLSNPPPPQNCGEVHVPQSSWPPQPSPAKPQL
jgi:hypothetical protein